MPLTGLSTCDCSTCPWAAPPMWKVRIVSCVPGLADGLRRDDAHGLAHVDRRAAGEIAPVALAADTRAALAGQHRAHPDGLDAGLVDLPHHLLVEHLARRP